ncbi:4161_t:CDS:10 [Diversispora eburnea]|uniref:4161_t:CDS:1 n=1 Tax=Diversispora eburnea TaxID=1213867 RepID=A0A9N8UVJ8_9GLOM|nr:4161_t:CDS:10 [Diversispora eburnea]
MNTSTTSGDLDSLFKEPDIVASDLFVVDFLNKHFSELEDLEKLDSVLDDLRKNEQNLNKKCIQLQTQSSKSLKESLESFNSISIELEGLQASRLELEDEFADYCDTLISTNSRHSQETTTKDMTLMEQLTILQQQVDSLIRSKQYLKVLVVSEELSSQAKQLIEKSPQKALIPYIQLAHLSYDIKSKSQEAGHVVTYLDVFLQQSKDALWEDMKCRLTKKFEQTLDSLNWPTPIKLPYSTLTTEKLSAFKKAFIELLLLQRPINVSEDSQSSSENTDNNGLPPLLPIQIMVEPLIIRFRYHFESKRPTDRIDKPEWYFTHVLNTIREHSPFLQGAVQAIVDEAGFQMYHAKNDFIRCLLDAVIRKLSNDAPTLLNSSQVFSHTVFETLQFDQTLRELHMYICPGEKEWKGCVDVFTGKKEWFKAWLKVEKEFVEARYNEIMHSENAWEMEEEDISEDEYKPTKSSLKLINLLELITSRYRLLPKFHNRIRFLADIQAALLESYAKRIESSVDAFENLSYSFVRAVPNSVNVDGKSLLGVEGLKRLCRWLNSAGFVSRTIKEWGEDAFFLELWHEVTVRASRITGTSSPTFSENSSNQTHDSPSEEPITVDEGTVFDEPAGLFDSSYQIPSQEQINKSLFVKEVAVPPMSKDFTKNTIIELSPELYAPLSDLAHSLTFLSNNLPIRIFKLIYKEISKELEENLWDRVLMRNQFSEMGGWQFKVDCEKGLFTVGRRWIQKPESYSRRLKDACILLTLPSTRQTTLVDEQSKVDSRQKTLEQIVSVLFDEELEPTAISRVLESIGIYHLSQKEAKEVVGRRVDCGK